MIKKLLLVCLITYHFQISFAQETPKLQSLSIDTTLTVNANAVIRSSNVIVEVNSVNSVTVKNKRIVTVFNKKGKWVASTYQYYSSDAKIKKQYAIIYDASGKEIKKFKNGDFEDQSIADGFSLVTDNRVKYLDYTPTSYPYTMVYESVVHHFSSMYIPGWYPVKGYKVSTENAHYKLINPNQIPLRFKENNFGNYDIDINNTSYELEYELKNTPALKFEQKAPLFNKVVPNVLVALSKFSFFGKEGYGDDWSSYGQWQYDNLVTGRGELPQQTIDEVSALLKDVDDTIEKAKLIYKYVQGKTRYISVQLGIGGWMPMKAEDVDELGYGDCKALTNYTKALMDSQKIPAYYTVVYGGNEKRNIDDQFASLQGNHVILNLPDGDNDHWLECTSQDIPFDFIAGFTDDRNVLVVTPEGGIIKRTKKYTAEENSLDTEASVFVYDDRSIKADVAMKSKGIQYNTRYRIPLKDKKDRELYYKKYWSYLTDTRLVKTDFKNNKKTIVFTENISIQSNKYGKKAGDRLLFVPNLFNREVGNLPKYEERKTPLVISRGFLDTDKYTIHLPDSYGVSGLNDPVHVETVFGTYDYEVTKTDVNTLIFERRLKINEGEFSKENYKTYRQFIEKIKKTDQSKIVLAKK